MFSWNPSHLRILHTRLSNMKRLWIVSHETLPVAHACTLYNFAPYTSPPPPPQNQGVPMLVPHHLKLPISGKGYYPLYLGYWLPMAITKNNPFFGLSREIFPRLRSQKYLLFPRKLDCKCGHLVHSSGGRGAIASCANKSLRADSRLPENWKTSLFLTAPVAESCNNENWMKQRFEHCQPPKTMI